jgi:hypothetical protein
LDCAKVNFRPDGERRQDALAQVDVFLGFVVANEGRRLTPLERPG